MRVNFSSRGIGYSVGVRGRGSASISVALMCRWALGISPALLGRWVRTARPTQGAAGGEVELFLGIKHLQAVLTRAELKRDI